MNMLEELMMKMIEFDCGDPKRIQHFIKVHSFSKLIGEKEGLDAHTLFVLEAASILHDIGTVSYTHLTLPTNSRV